MSCIHNALMHACTHACARTRRETTITTQIRYNISRAEVVPLSLPPPLCVASYLLLITIQKHLPPATRVLTVRRSPRLGLLELELRCVRLEYICRLTFQPALEHAIQTQLYKAVCGVRGSCVHAKRTRSVPISRYTASKRISSECVYVWLID